MKHTDPVCGKKVDPDHAAAESIWGNHHYYFDSTACRDRFEESPERYIGRERDGGLERHEPPFTTTDVSITAPKFGSAGSGGAEFERLPERHLDEEDKARKPLPKRQQDEEDKSRKRRS